jgi:CubicO group peptidase (beta-lactamase class C family)
MTHVLALVIAAWLWSGSGRPVQTLHAWLDTDAAAFSGAVLIARDDTIETLKAYGGVEPTGRFNIGSINKTFTAMAVAQLIQRGRLSLDDTVAKHLPDYPNRDAAAKITIRQLITHRSGVAQFMGANFGEGSVADVTKTVGAQPQVFEPGARQEYSNGGYVVLGRIVEVASGTSYAAYITENIFTPAGMTLDAGNPAGGAKAPATDLFKFARALKGGKLLDPRMTEYVMNGTFAPEPGPKFGFALREQVVGSRRFIGNGGGAPGINAEFRFEPAGPYTVVVLANTSPPAATRLLAAILARL